MHGVCGSKSRKARLVYATLFQGCGSQRRHATAVLPVQRIQLTDHRHDRVMNCERRARIAQHRRYHSIETLTRGGALLQLVERPTDRPPERASLLVGEHPLESV